MRVTYDREGDILMVEVADEGAIDHAEHTGPFIAHFGPEGELLLLEILDASEFLMTLMKSTLRSQEQDVPLRVGAG
jgi:uncharacterized protein YuzE